MSWGVNRRQRWEILPFQSSVGPSAPKDWQGPGEEEHLNDTSVLLWGYG